MSYSSRYFHASDEAKLMVLMEIRKIYFPGIFGFVFLPAGWTSFQNDATQFESVKGMVGSFGYLALVLFLTLQFASRVGFHSLSAIIMGEVFPFR